MPYGATGFPFGRTVIFKDHSAKHAPKNADTPPIPLPNPRYVGLHNAFAGVIRMSGVTEVLDDIIRALLDDVDSSVVGESILRIIEHDRFLHKIRR